MHIAAAIVHQTLVSVRADERPDGLDEAVVDTFV
jgi:hypothetical protein